MTTSGKLVHMTNIPVKLPPVGDLKDLVAWQVAMDLAERVSTSFSLA